MEARRPNIQDHPYGGENESYGRYLVSLPPPPDGSAPPRLYHNPNNNRTSVGGGGGGQTYMNNQFARSNSAPYQSSLTQWQYEQQQLSRWNTDKNQPQNGINNSHNSVEYSHMNSKQNSNNSGINGALSSSNQNLQQHHRMVHQEEPFYEMYEDRRMSHFDDDDTHSESRYSSQSHDAGRNPSNHQNHHLHAHPGSGNTSLSEVNRHNGFSNHISASLAPPPPPPLPSPYPLVDDHFLDGLNRISYKTGFESFDKVSYEMEMLNNIINKSTSICEKQLSPHNTSMLEIAQDILFATSFIESLKSGANRQQHQNSAEISDLNCKQPQSTPFPQHYPQQQYDYHPHSSSYRYEGDSMESQKYDQTNKPSNHTSNKQDDSELLGILGDRLLDMDSTMMGSTSRRLRSLMLEARREVLNMSKLIGNNAKEQTKDTLKRLVVEAQRSGPHTIVTLLKSCPDNIYIQEQCWRILGDFASSDTSPAALKTRTSIIKSTPQVSAAMSPSQPSQTRTKEVVLNRQDKAEEPRTANSKDSSASNLTPSFQSTSGIIERNGDRSSFPFPLSEVACEETTTGLSLSHQSGISTVTSESFKAKGANQTSYSSEGETDLTVTSFDPCDTMAEELGQLGACELLVKAMVKHSAIVSIQCWCCRCLYLLATDCADNHNKLGKAGACEALVQTLRNYPNQRDVAGYGCLAVAHLAWLPHNRDRLCGMGCEATLETASLAFHDDKDGLLDVITKAQGQLAGDQSLCVVM